MAETILLYGDSGTYKSSNLGEAAEYIFETTGGVCLLVSADSGWQPMANQVERGVIIPWNITSSKWPVSSLMRVSKGFWPEAISAEGIANEATMKPITRWATRANPAKEGEFAIGGMLFEGLAMIGEMIMTYLTDTQRSTGEPLVSVFEEQGEKFSMGSRGSYKFTQEQTRKYVFNLKSLPCDRVIVTSHEGKGEDDQKRLIFGPALVGKAGTDKIPSWFESTLHSESYQVKQQRKDGKGKAIEVETTGVRVYFDRHRDNDVKTIYWPAKLSVPPSVKSKIVEKYPENYFPCRLDAKGNYVEGLHTFMRLMDEERGAVV